MPKIHLLCPGRIRPGSEPGTYLVTAPSHNRAVLCLEHIEIGKDLPLSLTRLLLRLADSTGSLLASVELIRAPNDARIWLPIAGWQSLIDAGDRQVLTFVLADARSGAMVALSEWEVVLDIVDSAVEY